MVQLSWSSSEGGAANDADAPDDTDAVEEECSCCGWCCGYCCCTWSWVGEVEATRVGVEWPDEPLLERPDE
jgi:hypothetical protein